MELACNQTTQYKKDAAYSGLGCDFVGNQTRPKFIPCSLLALVVLFFAAERQLRPDIYAATCTNLASIVRGAMVTAVSVERRMGASVLRLQFHDCFVQVRTDKLFCSSRLAGWLAQIDTLCNVSGSCGARHECQGGVKT